MPLFCWQQRVRDPCPRAADLERPHQACKHEEGDAHQLYDLLQFAAMPSADPCLQAPNNATSGRCSQKQLCMLGQHMLLSSGCSDIPQYVDQVKALMAGESPVMVATVANSLRHEQSLQSAGQWSYVQSEQQSTSCSV